MGGGGRSGERTRHVPRVYGVITVSVRGSPSGRRGRTGRGGGEGGAVGGPPVSILYRERGEGK